MNNRNAFGFESVGKVVRLFPETAYPELALCDRLVYTEWELFFIGRRGTMLKLQILDSDIDSGLRNLSACIIQAIYGGTRGVYGETSED